MKPHAQIYSWKMVYFLIPSMVLGLLDQLQIFSQLVASDRIAMTFDRSRATRAVALDISKAFDRVCHAGLLHILKSCGISGQMFGLISSFLSDRWLWVILDGKSLQEYPVNAGVLQGPILGPTLSYYTLMTFQTILSMILLSLLVILLSKCDQASDLWQQLKLASELESDLRDTGLG